MKPENKLMFYSIIIAVAVTLTITNILKYTLVDDEEYILEQKWNGIQYYTFMSVIIAFALGFVTVRILQKSGKFKS